MKPLLYAASVLTLLAAPLASQSTPPASPEQQLMEGSYLGDLETVKRLVLKGAKVDAVDPENRTSLMWAAFNGHTAVVEYLILRDAKVDAKDSSGRTALMYASSGPYAETVALLLEKGAEVNVQGSLEGFTALMTAAAEGQVEVVRLLLDHGADPSLKDKDGDTAKSFAQENGHSAVVALLESPSP
jgi:ankyrin repeat protein